MILDKEVEINIGCGRQRKYFRGIGHDCNIGDIIKIKPEELQARSAFKINVKCDICGNEKQLSYVKYLKNTKNLTEDYACCEKCAVEKIKRTKFENHGDENYSNRKLSKKTCLEKYGVENAGGLDSSIEKIKQTKLEKHGDENYNNIKQIKKTNLEKYGFENVFQNEAIKETIEQTNLKLYGVKYPVQNEEVKKKTENTNIERYGFKSSMQNKEVQEKSRETCRKNHGVEYPTQSREVFLKGIKTRFKIEKYGDTSLTYQAGYEKYFLEKMEEKGLLTEVSNGKSYDYELNSKQHVYHSDFLFRNLTIEIKSGWTYNDSGVDMDAELENETKWQAVIDNGDELLVLWSKKEIKEFVQNLIIN